MNQAQWEEVESKLWTDGVIAGARNGFATTTTSGLGISVNTGDAILDGFRFYADATTALTAATADPSLPRIDLLVLRIDETAHTSTIALKTGTPASSPVAPTATKTVGGTYELPLYQVRVNAASSTITSLTDVRTYCGPTNAVNKSGDTMTGQLNGTTAVFSSHLTALDATLTAASSGIEIGDTGSSNTPHIDFHSSGNNIDYDTRLVASGGSGTNGAGTLNIQTTTLQHNGNTIWDSANDGSGSGLDADTVDGLDSAAFAQTGANNSITPLKISGGTALPGTLGSREIFILLA